MFLIDFDEFVRKLIVINHKLYPHLFLCIRSKECFLNKCGPCLCLTLCSKIVAEPRVLYGSEDSLAQEAWNLRQISCVTETSLAPIFHIGRSKVK